MPRCHAHRPSRLAPPAPRCHARRPCPVVRSRCGRVRCPHRAAAPSARCAALPLAPARPHPAPSPCALTAAPHRPWRLATAVRGFAPPAPSPHRIARGGSPPRCVDLPPSPPPHVPRGAHAHYTDGAMGTSRPTATGPPDYARQRERTARARAKGYGEVRAAREAKPHHGERGEGARRGDGEVVRRGGVRGGVWGIKSASKSNDVAIRCAGGIPSLEG